MSSWCCCLARARVVTISASFTVGSVVESPSSSASWGTSVPSRTDLGSDLDTAASTLTGVPSTTSSRFAKGYNTTSPWAQRIVTAPPSKIFSGGTRSSLTRVFAQPVSKRMSSTAIPSTVPERKTPISPRRSNQARGSQNIAFLGHFAATWPSLPQVKHLIFQFDCFDVSSFCRELPADPDVFWLHCQDR